MRVQSAGRLTTHVLDTANGCPAAGIKIELSLVTQNGRTPLVSTVTNVDGRTDVPLLQDAEFKAGTYEIVFHAGDYFSALEASLPDPLFLDIVPIRFGIADESAHYHVPLLISPYSYSTYRGS